MNEYCAFCDALHVYEYLAEIDDNSDIEHRQTVAIIDGIYKKKRKTIRGRTVNFGDKGRGFELNFCPSCGRDLKGNEEGKV